MISAADGAGRLGRSAYSYSHQPMVAGIIVTAAGDGLTISHPGEQATVAAAAVILGGPVLLTNRVPTGTRRPGAVMAATTPGTARAGDTPTPRIQAWACGLRTRATCSTPGICRNRSRRWRSMSACGNRQKAAAYYRRQRGLAPAGP